MEDKNESIEKINESLLKVFKEIDDLFLLLSKVPQVSQIFLGLSENSYYLTLSLDITLYINVS